MHNIVTKEIVPPALGVSKDAVHRVGQEAGLKPHRLERYMASDDPEFESKAADILGLYLNGSGFALDINGTAHVLSLSGRDGL